MHVLRPQTRFFTDPPTETNEAAIKTLAERPALHGLGRPDAEGRWQLRLWWKPLVTLIWLGGVLVGLGGLLAFVGHARRAWRRRALDMSRALRLLPIILARLGAAAPSRGGSSSRRIRRSARSS